jgi:hypothetical protein
MPYLARPSPTVCRLESGSASVRTVNPAPWPLASPVGGTPVRKGEQPPWIVPDGLWERIEPLLPVVERRSDHPGRRRLDDRKVLSGILFVLYTGIPWEFLPQELGFGSRMTC